ncbi:glycosyltransferase family 2 protein [Bifidobacterium dentium]|uniref:glycosyltransferase family 2 protein n=1 Tax=Bifidobacterium dentium TaxID=1689 RepID=UPI003D16512D
MTSSVSVVIPAYNAGKYIEQCLRTISDGNPQGLVSEIIVVDDGSYDDTREIVTNYAKKHPIVKYMFQKNAGEAVARNTGYRCAKCEWIMFVDADDWLSPDYRSILSDSIKKYGESSDIIVFDFYYDTVGSSTIRKTSKQRSNTWSKKDLSYVERLCVSNIDFSGEPNIGLLGSLWGKLYPRAFLDSLVDRYGYLIENDIKRGEDVLFNVRAFQCARKIRYETKAFYHYVERANSTSHSAGGKTFVSDVNAYLSTLSDLIKSPELSNLELTQCLWQNAFTFVYEVSLRNNRNMKVMKRSTQAFIDGSELVSAAIKDLDYSMLSKAGRVRLFALRHKLWMLYALLIGVGQAKRGSLYQ